MKTVLITGAASGVGKAIAQTFLDAGDEVIGIDCHKASLDHINFVFHQLDLTEFGKVDTLRLQLKDQGKKIDMLINNAGVFQFLPISDTHGDELSKLFQINTIAPFHLIHCFLEDLVEKSGMVIQISSENVKINGLFQPYPPTKIALEALSTAARQELKLLGVKLVIIEPGAIDTPLLNWNEFRRDSIFKDYIQTLMGKAKKQVKRPISPEELARKVLRISRNSKPRRVYRINNSPFVSLVSILPQSLQDKLMVRSVK